MIANKMKTFGHPVLHGRRGPQQLLDLARHSRLPLPQRPFHTVPQRLSFSTIRCPHAPRRPCRLPNTPQTTRPYRQQSRFNSSQQKPASRPSSDPTENLGSPGTASGPSTDTASLSIMQRLRKLGREYGWAATGVYLAFSALDFPFCFLGVRMLGTDRIGHWEHIAVGYAWKILTLDGRLSKQAESDLHDEETVGKQLEGNRGVVAVSEQGGKILDQASEGQGWSWGVEEAEQANQHSDATIWTQLALAYAIHKSFIFIRVPLTVAATPKVVKVLRGWGWDIGKRRPKGS